jgi:hypothetical protein
MVYNLKVVFWKKAILIDNGKWKIESGKGKKWGKRKNFKKN